MAEKSQVDPSGLIRIDLGEGPVEIDLRTREDDAGPVIYLVVQTGGAVALSIAVRSAEQASLLGAGAMAIARAMREPGSD